MGTLHEDVFAFTIFRWIALRTEIFQINCIEKIKTHILCSVTFSWKSCRLWDIVKKMAEPNRSHSRIWYCACALLYSILESTTITWRNSLQYDLIVLNTIKCILSLKRFIYANFTIITFVHHTARACIYIAYYVIVKLRVFFLNRIVFIFPVTLNYIKLLELKKCSVLSLILCVSFLYRSAFIVMSRHLF
jgi:hypothetical protein